MHFALTEEQAAIQETALTFAKERIAPFAAEWDEKSHFPVDVIRETAALGMAAIYVPAEQGGSGLSRLDGALIMEALAYGCPPISAYISIHNMVAWMVGKYASDAQSRPGCPSSPRMDWLSGYCLTEPGAGSDAAALKTSAKRSGDHYVLNGSKQFISGAGAADFYFVFARTGDEGANGISAFAVMKDTPGLSFGAQEKKMGWNAQPTRQVIFENCKVPAANLHRRGGPGFRFAMSGLDGGRINIGACSVGAAWAALDKARQYMLERKAFGRADRRLPGPAVQDRRHGDRARGRAADDLSRRRRHRPRRSAGLHVFGHGQAPGHRPRLQVCNEALQIHGGYGYLKDYGLEKLVRDLRVHQILEGTNEIMRVVISRKVLGGNRG